MYIATAVWSDGNTFTLQGSVSNKLLEDVKRLDRVSEATLVCIIVNTHGGNLDTTTVYNARYTECSDIVDIARMEAEDL